MTDTSGPFLAAERTAMRRALALATRARGRMSPNPRVGAVVLRDGIAVGEGFHRGPGTSHAEAVALAAAGEAAHGATLVVTLEPCTHAGHTPPCTDAILAAGIRRVVYAAGDPNPQAAGGAAKLRADSVDVAGGLCDEESWQLNDAFHVWHESGRPFVALKVAASLDGSIAAPSGDARWITSLHARRYGHRLRAASDAILVGIGTILADDSLLTVRHTRGRHPLRVVMDSQLRMPDGAQVLRDDAATVIFTTAEASQARLAELRGAGHDVVVARTDSEGRVDPVSVLEHLGQRDIRSVLLEGGRGIYTAFLRAGLVDRMHVFVAPCLLGGDGLGWTGNLEIPPGAGGPQLLDPRIRRIGPDTLIEGYLRPATTVEVPPTA